MNWKLKARIQAVIAALPAPMSYAVYYWIQRRFGGLKQVNPLRSLLVGVQTCEKIREAGHSPVDKTFLEIGTGRTVNLPLAYWLLGAGEIITVDVNPYLKEELIRENLSFYRDNVIAVRKVFDGQLYEDRFQKLLHFSETRWQLVDLFELLNLKYIAPGDGTSLDLDSQVVDYHVSSSVFEHIPAHVIPMILREGNRVLQNNGLFVHRIDFSDHFSHSDASISRINFLQFDDREWNRIAGNRYMYMNRLRADDMLALFKAAGHEIICYDRQVDKSVEAVLTSGKLMLNKNFADKPTEILATTSSWIVSKKSKLPF